MILLLGLLTGCKGEENWLEGAIAFRTKLISEGGCSFRAQITADYGKESQSFTLDCQGYSEGSLQFTVLEPETIADITGEILPEGGRVTYDGLQLAFPLLASGQISPVSAPGYVLTCWLKEFILSAGMSDGIYRVSYEKKINEKVLLIDTYFEKDIPIFAELCYNGFRILSIKITEFVFL